MYQLLKQDDYLYENEYDELKSSKLNDNVSKMDNPIWYIAKVCFVYLLVFLDMFLNSEVGSGSIDTMTGGLRTFWPFIFLVAQTSVQLFIFLTIFLLMCNTYMMRIGLPGLVMSDFKYLVISQIVYLILTIVLGMIRILYFENYPLATTLELWDAPGFEAFFIIQNLGAALYYHQVIFSTFRLADTKYYVKVSKNEIKTEL